jgi:acetoin utilization deacetylase AcuC-like enzyme
MMAQRTMSFKYHCKCNAIDWNPKPDFIFYLAGVDILASDKLGKLGCTLDGCKKRDELVFELCSKHQILYKFLWEVVTPKLKLLSKRMLIRIEQLKIYSKKCNERTAQQQSTIIVFLFNYCLPNKSNSLATTCYKSFYTILIIIATMR